MVTPRLPRPVLPLQFNLVTRKQLTSQSIFAVLFFRSGLLDLEIVVNLVIESQ